MPSNNSHKTLLRSSGYSALVYMSVLDGDEVLEAELVAPDTYPAKTLTISINSGSIGNVQRGYRVVVESASGAYKGTTNVRFAGTLDSTHLPIRETNLGSIALIAGDILRVYDDVVLGDKLVEDTSEFDPDGVAYTDQGSNPAPVVCSGGVWCGFVEDASAIPLPGDASYTVDPDSGGTMTHLWAATGGSLSATNIAAPTITYSAAGKYRLDHTVTDSSNSKSRTQHVRHRVHDANDPPYEVVLDSPPTADEESGWSATIRVFENATLADIHDGAMVALWVPGQTFGTATAGRHHMLLVGYLRRDTQNINPVLNELRFEIISPLAYLAGLPGFSKVMLREQSPDAWNEIKTLTVKRGIVQLIAYYSTLIEAGYDLIFNGFSDADYTALFLEKANPYAQVVDLASSRASRFVCLREGRFEVQGRLEVVLLGSRAAITTTYTIGMDDIDAGEDGTSGIDMTREHYRPVETYRLQGFTAGGTTNNPVFARWPGSPGTGNQSTTTERFITDNPAQAYEWCGMLGAAANSDFQYAFSSLQHAPSISVPVRGAYWAIFDFHREYIAFEDYEEFSNLRGIDLTGFRWQFNGLSMDWDESGFPRTVLELKAETAGLPGVDDTPPSDGTGDFTDPDDIWDFEDINPNGRGLQRGTQTLLLPNTDGYLYFMGPTLTGGGFDVQSASGGPVIDRVAMGLTGDPYHLSIDAFSPNIVGTGVNVRGWISTEQTIYHFVNGQNPSTVAYTRALDGGSPLTFVAGRFATLASERGTPNRVLCVINNNTGGTYWTWTSDGLNWSTPVLLAAGGSGSSKAAGAFVSGKSNLMLASSYGTVYKSTLSTPSFIADSGLDPGADHAGTFVVPWNQPTDDIGFEGGDSGGAFLIHRISIAGSSKVDVTPTISGQKYGLGFPQAIAVSPSNRNRVVFIGQTGNGVGNYAIFRATDGGQSAASWEVIYGPVNISAMPYYECAMVDDNTAYFWGNGIGYAIDLFGSGVIDDRTGNLAADFPSHGRFIGIYGGG